MSDPTLLTTVTAEAPAAPKESFLTRIAGKTSSLLWLLVVGLVVAVVFLYMWRRGDRLALLATRRNQMNLVSMDQCSSLIEESILEYDRQRNQMVAQPDVTTTKPAALDTVKEEADEDCLSVEEEEEEEEEDSTSEEEEEDEEEEDDYDRAMADLPKSPLE
jgi:hypothetical protein